MDKDCCKRCTPDDMPDLPMSDVSMDPGTNGAATSMAALNRGFEKVSDQSSPVTDGLIQAGQPGFLGRANGWER